MCGREGVRGVIVQRVAVMGLEYRVPSTERGVAENVGRHN